MVIFHHLFQNQTFAPELINAESSKRHKVYLCGRKKGIGKLNYYVVRSIRRYNRRKEIEEACRIRERIQGMGL